MSTATVTVTATDREGHAAQATVTYTDLAVAGVGVPPGTVLKRVPQDVTTAAQAGGINSGWGWDGTRINASTNGVIDRVDVNGAVYNNGGTDARTAGKLTITKSKIRCTNENNWGVTLGSGSLLQDCEVGGGANGTTIWGAIGVLAGRWNAAQTTAIVQRCYIHHVEHGGRSDGNAHWLNNLIDALPTNDSTNHVDGIMCTAGDDNLFDGNTFRAAVNNSQIFIQWQTGNVNIGVVTISNNTFECHCDSSGQCPSWGVGFEHKGLASGKTRTISNNVFQRGWGGSQTGTPIECPTGTTVTGNKFTDGSAATVQFV
jgi:hypothetical protein